MKRYIMALDQGTTSSRAIVFDREQNIVEIAQKEFKQLFPQPGWVEHDPMDIYGSQSGVLTEAITRGNIPTEDIAAIGITNQRETTILWDRWSGLPVYNAIVWQCRRTAALCEELKAAGYHDYIRENTGLVIDAYFSATKIKWILDHVEGAREKAKRGDLLFGTVDSWLVWKLTNGAAHVTDMTNAARTMLFNIKTKQWDEKILSALDIPAAILPEVKSSSEIYGYAELGHHRVPIAGIAGDQQAALFGQACFQPGDTKNTYGTGCFLLMNTGEHPAVSKNGLLTTIAISLQNHVQYALEGSVFTGGAVIQWLRDQLGLLEEAQDAAYFAQKVTDTNGAYIVPAFTGLGAPHWDMYAQGTIVGLTRGTNKNHLIRAALESIAYQTKDVLDATAADSGLLLRALKADGGASANDFLMQFQADTIERPVLRPRIMETTALGAAYLAGLAVQLWDDPQEIAAHWTLDEEFIPQMPKAVREEKLSGWQRALRCCKTWSTGPAGS